MAQLLRWQNKTKHKHPSPLEMAFLWRWLNASASHCPQLPSLQSLSLSCPLPPMNWYLQGAARGRADKQLWGMDRLPLYKAKLCPASCPYSPLLPQAMASGTGQQLMWSILFPRVSTSFKMPLGTGQGGGYRKMGRDCVLLGGGHEMGTSRRPSTAPRTL